MQDLPVGGIAEADAVELDFAVHRRVLAVDIGVGRIGAFLFFVEKAEDAFSGSRGGLQLVDDVGGFVDRPAEFARIEHEGGDVADGDALREIEQGAEDGDEGEGDVVDEIHRRADHGAVVIRLEIGVRGGLVLSGEAGDHRGLGGIRADGLLPGKALLGVSVQLTQLAASGAEERAEPVGHHRGRHDGEGDGEREHKAELRGDRDHHGEGTGDGHDRGGDLHQIRGEGGVDGVDVVGDARDDVARLIHVEIPDLHLHELGEDVFAHAADYPAGEVDHHKLQHVGHDGGNRIGSEHQQTGADHLFEVDLSRDGADGVDRPAREFRPHEGKQVREDGEGKREQVSPAEAEHVFSEAQEHLELFLRYVRHHGVFRAGHAGTSIQGAHLPSAIR